MYLYFLIIGLLLSLYFFYEFISQKEYLKTVFIILLCISVFKIGYGHGIKVITGSRGLDYYYPVKKFMATLDELLINENIKLAHSKIKVFNQRIPNIFWRDSDGFRELVNSLVEKE
jgi:hypothetical protein